jgi:hypothetical protein
MNPNPENAESTASEMKADLESSDPQADLVKLGPSTSSVLEALQADLERARRIAANYQTVLKGKESELARITELFEKTRSHLIELQINVTKLRDERHRLGNRAMEADALERKLTVITNDRDRLRDELLRRERWHG